MTYGYTTTSIEKIVVPNTSPLIIDDFTLAFFLGFRNKTLWYALHCKKDLYRVFRILKSDGRRRRIIHAPNDTMKGILRQAHARLLLPLQDELGNHVTAYRTNRSIVDAVKRHIPACDVCDSAPADKTPKKHDCPKRGAYIHMDLKDFFHNTSRAYIRNYLRSLGYSFYVSGLIANLLTVDDIPNPAYRRNPQKYSRYRAGVPQGSPASGAICNLVANHRIDREILEYIDELNKKHDLKDGWEWVYSRYADDLTFTCGRNFTKDEKRKIVKRITAIIQKGGYKVNYSKTRVSSSFYRKTLLGIVFNQKANIAKEDYLRTRALVHNCLTQGFDTQYQRAKQADAEKLMQYLRGKINFINQVHPGKGQKLMGEFQTALQLHTGKCEPSNVIQL